MGLNSPPTSTIDRAQILTVASSMGFLGTGPVSAPHMLAMLCSPDISQREVAALLKQEPAIYARVLRVANSAYYGQTRAITTLERAVPLLGLDAVRGIAGAACLERAVSSGISGSHIDMKPLLDHTVATAIAAESLARIRHPSLVSEAFIAGLLHNLGVVVQARLDSPGVEAMISARRRDDPRAIRDLELAYAAVGHEECVAVIFEAWQLPESLLAAVRHHHDPMAAPAAHRDLAALVNLGACLGLASGNTYMLEPTAGLCDVRVMQQLQLLEAEFNGVAAELPERAAKLRSALLSA
jgi:HD-like signal output (HDOD) protein